jgi:YggT family protein
MDLIITAVNTFFNIMHVMLFIRVLLSWFPMARGSRLMEMLFFLTEPILVPIRKLVQKSPLGGPGMIIDFSVLIAFVLLRLAQSFVISLLVGL